MPILSKISSRRFYSLSCLQACLLQPALEPLHIMHKKHMSGHHDLGFRRRVCCCKNASLCLELISACWGRVLLLLISASVILSSRVQNKIAAPGVSIIWIVKGNPSPYKSWKGGLLEAGYHELFTTKSKNNDQLRSGGLKGLLGLVWSRPLIRVGYSIEKGPAGLVLTSKLGNIMHMELGAWKQVTFGFMLNAE